MAAYNIVQYHYDFLTKIHNPIKCYDLLINTNILKLFKNQLKDGNTFSQVQELEFHPNTNPKTFPPRSLPSFQKIHLEYPTNHPGRRKLCKTSISYRVKKCVIKK